MQAAPTPSFYVGSLPYKAAVADFNNDGNADIVTVHPIAGYLVVSTGNGDGTFSFASSYTFTQVRALACVDFNNDGNQDIALIIPNGVSVLFGLGNASFIPGFSQNFGSYLFAIASADFNNDNVADLAIVDTYLRKVHVMQGNGLGSFSSVAVCRTDSVPYDITTGDFNGDGYTDMATANYGDGADGLTIMLATGNGSFSSVNVPVGFTVFYITSGDYNADGKADIAVAGFGWLKIYLSGFGGLLAAGTYSLNSGNVKMVTADFNMDGKLDIGCSCYGNKRMFMLQGQGNGSFNAPLQYTADLGPLDIVAGDFNNDGKTDASVVNYNADNVSVFLNDIPKITISGPPVVCIGQTAVLVASGAQSYTWNALNSTATLVVMPPSSATYYLNASSLLGCTNTAQYNLVLSNCSSLEEPDPADIVLFPNPAAGSFFISGVSSSAVIKVHNGTGSEINFVTPGDGSYELPHGCSGFYFITVEEYGTKRTAKLIVNR
jgi:hypothetical protein